jgi:hypothetical protein
MLYVWGVYQIIPMRDKRIADNYKLALEVAEKHKCYFIEQVVSHLPISSSTFYEYFPAQSEESETIREILNRNKIETKTKMYNKWFESDNATLQMGLMKLIGNEEQAHRLNGTRIETNNKNTNIELTPEERAERIKELRKKL